MKFKTTILLSVCMLVLPILSYSQYQKINSNGLDIYYRIFGEGTPILVLGGGPGDVSDRYLSLCDLLSKDFRCILVEQRGVGKSAPGTYDETTINIALTINDFEVIRKQLGIDEWNVLGFSYGGYLASAYTDRYPGPISSLILLGSMGLDDTGFSHFLDNITSKLWASDLELIEYWSDSVRVAKDPKHAIVERIKARMPGYFYDRKKSLTVSQNMKDSDFDFEAGNWIWKDIYDNDLFLSTTESSFNKPVLILHGRQDPLGESVPHTLAKYYKNSKIVFIEKSGHYSWLEQPENVKNNIKDFLKN